MPIGPAMPTAYARRMLGGTEHERDGRTMATGGGDEAEGAWALDGVVRDALAGLPGGDPAAALETVDDRWLAAGIRLGLTRPDQARVLLELIANRASIDGADAAPVDAPRVPDETAAPEDGDDPPAIPVASALLARAAGTAAVGVGAPRAGRACSAGSRGSRPRRSSASGESSARCSRRAPRPTSSAASASPGQLASASRGRSST